MILEDRIQRKRLKNTHAKGKKKTSRHKDRIQFAYYSQTCLTEFASFEQPSKDVGMRCYCK